MHKFLFILISLFYAEAEAQQPSALGIADSLSAVGNFSEAIDTYQKIDTQNALLFLKIARAFRAKGSYERVLHFFAKAAKEKEAAIAKNEYGTLLITTRKFKKADSIYSILIDNYGKNPNFYYQRGRARMQISLSPPDKKNDSSMKAFLAKKEGYITDFKKAVALDSTHQKALYETAKVNLQQKEFKTVEKLCFKALKTYPANVQIIGLLGQENYMRGFCTDAIKWYSKLLELSQETKFIHEHLGMCYYKNGNYDLAIEQYLHVLNYDDEDWYTHENLSKLYNLTGGLKEAEKHGKLAIEFKDLPLEGDYYTLANTYKLGKKWRKAITFLNKALTENPDLKKARYAKAVVADNYYKDREAVLKLYDDFIERFEGGEYAKYDPQLELAKERAKMIREELFMAEGTEK